MRRNGISRIDVNVLKLIVWKSVYLLWPALLRGTDESELISIVDVDCERVRDVLIGFINLFNIFLGFCGSLTVML